ncbi:hypothetical protein CEXT_807771 [Caerostris extrusa]|uniref:Uncharacterized protein n=1 Tax=Caerostris extrusa TaxID=172846 RepID=A0AAV4V5S0_CAEEX|nr:hypothetical protein CEXT_807771 [Caerostris extrusa]
MGKNPFCSVQTPVSLRQLKSLLLLWNLQTRIPVALAIDFPIHLEHRDRNVSLDDRRTTSEFCEYVGGGIGKESMPPPTPQAQPVFRTLFCGFYVFTSEIVVRFLSLFDI